METRWVGSSGNTEIEKAEMIAQLDNIGLFHVAKPRLITQCVRVAVGLQALSNVPLHRCTPQEVRQLKREHVVVSVLRGA